MFKNSYNHCIKTLLWYICVQCCLFLSHAVSESSTTYKQVKITEKMLSIDYNNARFEKKFILGSNCIDIQGWIIIFISFKLYNSTPVSLWAKCIWVLIPGNWVIDTSSTSYLGPGLLWASVLYMNSTSIKTTIMLKLERIC